MFLRSPEFAHKTFVMEIIWGASKNYIPVFRPQEYFSSLLIFFPITMSPK